MIHVNTLKKRSTIYDELTGQLLKQLQNEQFPKIESRIIGDLISSTNLAKIQNFNIHVKMFVIL